MPQSDDQSPIRTSPTKLHRRGKNREAAGHEALLFVS